MLPHLSLASSFSMSLDPLPTSTPCLSRPSSVFPYIPRAPPVIYPPSRLPQQFLPIIVPAPNPFLPSLFFPSPNMNVSFPPPPPDPADYLLPVPPEPPALFSVRYFHLSSLPPQSRLHRSSAAPSSSLPCPPAQPSPSHSLPNIPPPLLIGRKLPCFLRDSYPVLLPGGRTYTFPPARIKHLLLFSTLLFPSARPPSARLNPSPPCHLPLNSSSPPLQFSSSTGRPPLILLHPPLLLSSLPLLSPLVPPYLLPPLPPTHFLHQTRTHPPRAEAHTTHRPLPSTHPVP
jgi:hypothetical protein